MVDLETSENTWVWTGGYLKSSSPVLNTNVSTRKVVELSVHGSLIEPVNPSVVTASKHLPNEHCAEINSWDITWALKEDLVWAYTNTSLGERSVGVLDLVTKRHRKEEFSIIIIGLDGAGKTTLLEKIKTFYNDTPRGLDPSKIGPTVGQNMGKVSLPSTILSFFDLGGQRGMRSIWHRYYDDCHAVVYVIDAQDRERLGEGWEVFGALNGPRGHCLFADNYPVYVLYHNTRHAQADSVLSSPRILNVPLLLLANKQDTSTSMSATEIRQDYEVGNTIDGIAHAAEECKSELDNKERLLGVGVGGVRHQKDIFEFSEGRLFLVKAEGPNASSLRPHIPEAVGQAVALVVTTKQDTARCCLSNGQT
ncbi:P-loop containing nucleoside triphosphate hydrolase protein [Boletus edulis BED1]|uniref:P-loop containing nucleoside triphosphate hydrolase protein n=1 Tax=Boletus edulis BED1 TaxID=1328754 RepID=A0AAD4BEU7_BOLED|nr:P-loop containing nucleoside triphosphate hydrolase protein [Boletus edulis BED1]